MEYPTSGGKSAPSQDTRLRVSSVALSADCEFIVSGSEDSTIKVWNIVERKEECTLSGHTG